ncbi:hypothetical protein [Geoalkalibacter sp.]|uniref:hypothetical protein n=1 Tax=Geoalkalibacter sp. TaxID=3041440 RepID=UPI00272E5EF3|nr:hypothetical protein [Geoalkalibacter sp.]
MGTSLNDFKSRILETLLGMLWRQWSALGVSGYSASEEKGVVDPEALLLLTCTVARYDARLFDEVLDWLDVNGAFLNVQRLQNLLKQHDFQGKAQLSAVAERLGRKSSTALKWKNLACAYALEQPEPLFFLKDGRALSAPSDPDEIFRKHGLLRSPVKLRGYAQPFPSEGMPSLLLRLRALLGVNVRCEILCLLGSVDEIHPSLIAKQIGHAPRTTQNALAEMARSGVVQVRSTAREKIYSLWPGVLDKLLRPPDGWTPWENSAPFFRAMEMLWLGLTDPRQQGLDELMLASEWRRLARKLRPLLGDAGWGQPLRDDAPYKGEKYAEVFVEDVHNLLSRIRR